MLSERTATYALVALNAPSGLPVMAIFKARARGSLRTFVFLVFDRMSLREHALMKDTGDKNASSFRTVKHDVLAVFKTI
jgi:hypothetical protein